MECKALKKYSFARILYLVILLTASTTFQEAIFSQPLPEIREVFHTDRDLDLNVDSPAVWHGENGENWLFATAKEGHSIVIFDAATGEYIQTLGSEGNWPLQFRRPNGIAVINDLLLVVERDNRRVQVLSLPGLSFISMIAHEDLRYPYGLTIDEAGDGTYDLYVTDNFNPALEGYPPEEELDERIHHYRLYPQDDGSMEWETVRLFGDIHGEGLLTKVESIYMDRRYNRLLIADESFTQRSIKIYDLLGNFTNRTIPNTYFTSEPEGLALYRCDDDSGYWIITDQHETDQNKFQVFDRETLEYIGGFRGEITRNTDGIWLTQKAFGRFDKGAFYPVHDDGSVTAISWSDISNSLGLEMDCTR